MDTHQFNVAILGFGLSGSTFHAPIITTTTGLKLSHILSRQHETITAKYPEVQVIDKLEELLTNPTIDLVINTLPNQEHYSVTRECLLAGKNVVVEKPFVIDSSEGLELIALAKKKNLLLSVYHNRRWDNGYLTLKKNLDKLGKIYQYEAYFDRFRPVVNKDKWREQPKPGTGILFDLGSHLIDQALQLFGLPEAVFADLQSQRPQAMVTDYFQITLYYPKLRVILGSCSVAAAARPVVAAYGEKGSYIKYGLDPQESDLRSGNTPGSQNWGIENPTSSGIITLVSDLEGQLNSTPIPSEAGSYQKFYHEIYLSLALGHTPPVSASSALDVINIIEYCQQSSLEQRIIKLHHS